MPPPVHAGPSPRQPTGTRQEPGTSRGTLCVLGSNNGLAEKLVEETGGRHRGNRRRGGGACSSSARGGGAGASRPRGPARRRVLDAAQLGRGGQGPFGQGVPPRLPADR